MFTCKPYSPIRSSDDRTSDGSRAIDGARPQDTSRAVQEYSGWRSPRSNIQSWAGPTAGPIGWDRETQTPYRDQHRHPAPQGTRCKQTGKTAPGFQPDLREHANSPPFLLGDQSDRPDRYERHARFAPDRTLQTLARKGSGTAGATRVPRSETLRSLHRSHGKTLSSGQFAKHRINSRINLQFTENMRFSA